MLIWHSSFTYSNRTACVPAQRELSSLQYDQGDMVQGMFVKLSFEATPGCVSPVILL